MSTDIKIPENLLPADGRFGAGPSKVRAEQVQAIVDAGPELLGTSHRQAPVKNLVASVQDGLKEMFNAPAGCSIARRGRFHRVLGCSGLQLGPFQGTAPVLR